MRKQWLFGIAMVLSLAACDGGGKSNTGTPPPPTPSATTLASFMAQLFGTTTESATPVDINGLNLDLTSEDPAQFNALIV